MIIVDGNAIAQEIAQEIKNDLSASNKKARLDIFVVEANRAIQSFVARKKRFAKEVGVEFIEHIFDSSVSASELEESILAVTSKTDAIVVQLPLPSHIDSSRVLNTIPKYLDVDVLAEKSFKDFAQDKNDFTPPVTGSILEILKVHNVPLKNKKITIIGKGKLVGAPTAIALTRAGADVFVADSATPKNELNTQLKNADIIISGAGAPSIITPELIKDGVVLIDAGTSGSKGVLKGDIDYACEEKASIFARTPGGVGPITVAILFKNVVKSFKQKNTRG